MSRSSSLVNFADYSFYLCFSKKMSSLIPAVTSFSTSIGGTTTLQSTALQTTSTQSIQTSLTQVRTTSTSPKQTTSGESLAPEPTNATDPTPVTKSPAQQNSGVSPQLQLGLIIAAVLVAFAILAIFIYRKYRLSSSRRFSKIVKRIQNDKELPPVNGKVIVAIPPHSRDTTETIAANTTPYIGYTPDSNDLKLFSDPQGSYYHHYDSYVAGNQKNHQTRDTQNYNCRGFGYNGQYDNSVQYYEHDGSHANHYHGNDVQQYGSHNDRQYDDEYFQQHMDRNIENSPYFYDETTPNDVPDSCHLAAGDNKHDMISRTTPARRKSVTNVDTTAEKSHQVPLQIAANDETIQAACIKRIE